MPKNSETIWLMEPHTEAKHEILKKYLSAWLPILTRWNGRILYIDGFAGPGEYIGGKDGSPIIAIKAVLDHKFSFDSDIIMDFIEFDQKRCDYLRSLVNKIELPDNLKVNCYCNEFNNVMGSIFDHIETKGVILVPSFVFIDPFGFSGIPMKTIKRIMSNPKCEVFITFMYDEMNRFIKNPENEKELILTFGTDGWKKIPEKGPKERLYFLHDLYKKQLYNEAGIKYVRSFMMVNKSNKTDYYLFFGTNNLTGLAKMKEAMWRVDESGAFSFSDVTYNPAQPFLFQPEPQYAILKKFLLKEYKGKEVSITDIEKFILTETPFLTSHYKTKIFKLMEYKDEPEIKVKCNIGKRRKGSYTDKCIIKFL